MILFYYYRTRLINPFYALDVLGLADFRTGFVSPAAEDVDIASLATLTNCLNAFGE